MGILKKCLTYLEVHMYKTESTLGLIGSILTVISASLTFIFSLVCRIILGWTMFMGSNMFRFFGPFAETGGAIFGGAFIIAVIFGLMITVAAAILGFIGTSQLRNGRKQGGTLLIIAGGLMLLPSYMGHGPFGTIISILFFIGGIMALTKKVNTENR
jgi:hypothetical protein